MSRRSSREWAWLEQFYTRIMRCRVVLEVRHHHGRNVRSFHVRVRLTVPGGAPITYEPSSKGDPDARLAIRDAFDVVRRRLEDFAREQRGTVKTHEGRESA